MDRRGFLSLTGVAAGGAGALLTSACTTALGKTAERPAAQKRAPMKLGCQRYSWGGEWLTDEVMRYYARHGVQNIAGGLEGEWTVGKFRKMQKHAESFGISVRLGRLWLKPSDPNKAGHNVLLDRGEVRDLMIEEICDKIRVAGEAGIPGLLYNVSVLPFGGPRTEPTPGRGGVSCSTWELAKADSSLAQGLTRPVSAETVWEGITYFLERVVPVAEKAGVRLACHPQDPPTPPGFRGMPRALGTVEGLKRFVSIAESDYHGLSFCQGSVAEMLHDPGNEIYDVIRWFGRRKKMFNVHFRNIRGRRDSFHEVYPDEGDVDMVRAMRVYKEVSYPYMIMPDHVPTHPDDPREDQGFAFAYGYIRALIQAVGTG